MSFNDFFHMTLVFWIVMDSPGNIPIYVSILNQFEPKVQQRIIWREMIIALLVMILFLFFGEAFFKVINIDTSSLQIAGGAILFLIAIRLLFSTPSEKKMRVTKEPLIVPLAIPAVAGPGILATITLYSGAIEGNTLFIALGIFVAWACSLPFLLLAPLLKKVIGENGLAALERLFGYIIILLATQLAIKGFVSTFHAST
jgi:multiple antibiotic resistance protein